MILSLQFKSQKWISLLLSILKQSIMIIIKINLIKILKLILKLNSKLFFIYINACLEKEKEAQRCKKRMKSWDSKLFSQTYSYKMI